MIKERSRHEIEQKLQTMGDYVRMDYLQRALSSNLDFETKKFVQITLAKIYEGRNMFSEAARLIKNAADINTTFKGKITDYMKAAELYVRGGLFDDADDVLKRAVACGNNREKSEVKENYKKFLMTQAEFYVKQDKRNHAKRTYEKLLSIDLTPNEKENIQKKLLALYERLGLIREYSSLKKSM